MLKDFLLVHGAPTVPPCDVQHYLQFTHAPFALTIPTTARLMTRYTMSHIVGEALANCGLYPPLAGLTTVVEHELGGYDGIASIMADEDYVAKIVPDEHYMVEKLMDGPPQFIVVDEEVGIFESDAPGSLRMFDFVRRPTELAREDFLSQLDEDGAWARSRSDYRSAVSQRVHSIVGTGATFFGVDAEPFDAVIETWVADADALAQLSHDQKERRDMFCDPDRSFSAMTEEYRIRG